MSLEELDVMAQERQEHRQTPPLSKQVASIRTLAESNLSALNALTQSAGNPNINTGMGGDRFEIPRRTEIGE